jgi:fatty-acyl-CoA synthase
MTERDDTMLGDHMQAWSMTVDRFITHAARWSGQHELVSREPDGSIVRSTWAASAVRARRLSAVLAAAGIRPGERIATMAMNTARHVEAWYGIMGYGAVCHTLNPRLFEDQLVYIINHASDRWLLADPQFAPLIEKLRTRCPTLERIVYLCGPERLPAGAGVADYESLIDGQPTDVAWGTVDEHAPAALCYTSGTTGNPKGMSVQDSVLAVVPMFHANAWALPFTAAATGAKFVLPGAKLDGASLYELLESEAVTLSAAVPTVWQGLLDYLTTNRLRLSSLRRVIIGGSAVTEALIRGFRDEHGVEVLHAWGMTEMSPIGTISGAPPPAVAAMDADKRLAYNLKQGRAPFGVDMKITDDEDRRLPHDGRTPGHLRVQGPAISARYYREEREALDAEGYFDTGDIGTIDGHGYLQITDRAKDLIKSGGEWISSVEIENIAAGHPKALMAAVVAIPHPRWRERPLLVVQLKEGVSATRDEFLGYLDGKIAKFWMPDDVVFIDRMPLGATGKLDKKVLRARYPGT